jgi:hypothetical protein
MDASGARPLSRVLRTGKLNRMAEVLFGVGGIDETRFFAIAFCSLALSGCVAQGRGDALYHTGDGQLAAPNAVAKLGGLIRTVDGLSVPEGHRFELLPGCHVITNSSRWTTSDTQGSVSASLRQLTFAIAMRAGYSYIVRVREGIWTGSSGTVTLIAEERDPDGKVTREIPAGKPCEES